MRLGPHFDVTQQIGRSSIQPEVSNLSLNPIRVLCVDDDVNLRNALARFFSRQTGIEMVGAIDSASELSRAIHEHRPHIVVMDLGMDGADPLTEMRNIAMSTNAPRFVILSGSCTPEVASRVTAMGASAFVDKSSQPSELLAVIRRVAGMIG